MTVDTNSLRYLPRRSSKNCVQRQIDRFKKNYSIDLFTNLDTCVRIIFLNNFCVSLFSGVL